MQPRGMAFQGNTHTTHTHTHTHTMKMHTSRPRHRLSAEYATLRVQALFFLVPAHTQHKAHTLSDVTHATPLTKPQTKPQTKLLNAHR